MFEAVGLFGRIRGKQVLIKYAGFFREIRLHGHPAGASPSILAARGLLPESERLAVAKYLQGGTVVTSTPWLVDDWFDKSNKGIAPLELRTDGEWVWPGDYAYYVERYSVFVPAEFREQMATRSFLAPNLGPADLAVIVEQMKKKQKKKG